MMRFREAFPPLPQAPRSTLTPGRPVSSETATERQKRLAQALRANLRKRKTQTRERAAAPTRPDDAQEAAPQTAQELRDDAGESGR